MQDIIEVRNLTKKYGDFVAVDAISFSVHRGEAFGILGPNGAGKTTTLEMIEGLKEITGGEAMLDGLDVRKEIRAVKAIIGVQLQSSSFFSGLNLKELLVTFASLYGRKVNAGELLEKVGLTDKAKNHVKELSGGQKQRLSIAVGLVNDPKVLFLDEPTTGLDPQARRNLWDLIDSIRGSGTTIVLTTHYMEEAEVLCDRIAIMDNAKIIALDTPTNLLKLANTDASIEFTAPEDIQNKLKSISGVDSVSQSGNDYLMTTAVAEKVLGEVFAMRDRGEASIQHLRLRQATLEDVFLQLTGKTLRD